MSDREIIIKIQKDGYPLIKETCEFSADEADRIGRFFFTIRDNMKAICKHKESDYIRVGHYTMYDYRKCKNCGLEWHV